MSDIAVIFDADKKSFQIVPQNFSVPAGAERTITYSLTTTNGDGKTARFESINELPNPPFERKVIDNETASVLDNNTNPGQDCISFGYSVSVTYQGINYTSQDPAIVNSGTG